MAVVIKIVADDAGSLPNLAINKGAMVPAAAATIKLTIIAKNKTSANNGSRLANRMTIATNAPLITPLTKPESNSFFSAPKEDLKSICLSVMPRTITAIACVPALPPIPAMIGIYTASKTYLAMV